MANPQTDNGFTRIANEIIEALVKYRIPGEQMQCLLLILRKTYGYHKKWDMISNSQFVEFTGLKKSSVCRAIKELTNKNLVYKKANNHIPTYCFNKNYDKWKVLAKKLTVLSVSKKVNKGVTKKRPTKDSITKDIYKNKDDFWFQKVVSTPKDIFLTDKMKAYVVSEGCEDQKHAELLFKKFINWHGSTGKKRANWTKAFYNWVLQDKEKYNADKYKQYRDVITERRKE